MHATVCTFEEVLRSCVSDEAEAIAMEGFVLYVLQ